MVVGAFGLIPGLGFPLHPPTSCGDPAPVGSFE